MHVSDSVPDSCMLLSRVQREGKKKHHGIITEDYIQTSVKGAIIGGSSTGFAIFCYGKELYVEYCP